MNSNLPNPIEPQFGIQFFPVPNQTKGRDMHIPDMIVLHITEGSKESVVQTFQDPAAKRSAHFMVNKDGSIYQFVSTSDFAWANGVIKGGQPTSPLVLSRMPLNPNFYTISIEHEGDEGVDITPEQYASSIMLCTFLCRKWNIVADRIHFVGHREIDPAKQCPGLVNVDYIVAQTAAALNA